MRTNSYYIVNTISIYNPDFYALFNSIYLFTYFKKSFKIFKEESLGGLVGEENLEGFFYT